MKIDLVTFIAQIVNLAVLIWLMKKFLYAPILKTVETRQKQIDDAEEKSKQSLKDALKKERLYDEKLIALEKKRTSFLEQAQDEADNLRKTLLKEVTESAETARMKFKESLTKEKKSVNAEIEEVILTEFKVLANRAFKELASSDLQNQMADIFSKKIRSISVTQKRQLLENAMNKGIVLEVGIKEKIPQTLEETLKDFFGDIKVKIRQNPELICGYALLVDEKEISWNLNAYMDEFSLELEKTLKGE